MTTKVKKWGNSLAVRIPKELGEMIRFQEGTDVTFSLKGNTIVISHSEKPKYTLESLMKNFDKKTEHELIDWGSDVGNEIIEPWGK